MLRLLKKSIDSLHTPLDIRDMVKLSRGWKIDMELAGSWRREKRNQFRYDLSDSFENSIVIAGSCSSVLDLSHYLLKKGGMEIWDSLLAFEQIRGRGRKGRRWYSPPGNIYGAIVLPPTPPRWRKLLTLFTGYVICDTLCINGFRARLKWPNDILLENRKVGGALIEEKSGRRVPGIGINLTRAPSGDYPDAPLSFPAGALGRDTDTSLTPVQVWDFLVRRFKKLYSYFIINDGIEEFLEAASFRLSFLNREVTVKRNEEKVFRAIFAGINREGGALLLSEGKEKIIYDGQIILTRRDKGKL